MGEPDGLGIGDDDGCGEGIGISVGLTDGIGDGMTLGDGETVGFIFGVAVGETVNLGSFDGAIAAAKIPDKRNIPVPKIKIVFLNIKISFIYKTLHYTFA